MYILCQKHIVPADTDPRYSTYCMRPAGHAGACAPEATEEDKKLKETNSVPRQNN